MIDTAAPGALINDRYRLGEVLQTGVGYETRRCHDVLLDRGVIARIRLYHPEQRADRLRHEAVARLIAPLSHHNLIAVLDLDSAVATDGSSRLLLVAEAARGQSLRRRLATGAPLTARQAAYVGFDLAEALEYLHEHGVVHRGLTTRSVLLAEQDEGYVRAQIAELTTAARADDPADVWTPPTESLPFVAPEQLRDGSWSPAADVYALALVVLEGLTGRRAFPDPVLRAAGPGLPVEIPGTVPEALADLLRIATADDPDARPTAAELAVGFRRALAAEMGRNRRVEPQLRSEDEEARLEALHRYDLLDTPPEGAFDRITTLAARVLDVPVSTVSIVDRDRIWFKSHFGLDGGEIARDPGLCATVVSTGSRVYIPDARADESSRANPLIAGDFGLQSYAGVPLTSVDGYTLGALSVADYRPRSLTREQLDTLEQLGAMITHELEMRLATRRAVLSHD